MKLVCALFLVCGVGALAAATIESNAVPKKVESDIAQIPKSKAGTTDPLHFNVTDKDGVCLLIEGSATFDVTYTLNDNSNGTASFGIPADAVVAGNCADAASNISVSFFTGYAFSLSFTVVDDKSLLSAVSLDYVYDAERFPNASDVGEANVARVDLSLALSSATESYRCHASVPVALGDRVNAVVADVRLQAFNVVNATYGVESVCTEDTVTTVAPTTPAPQPATPPVNSFVVVDDNNVTCLRVDAGIRFEILYKVNATVNATAMVDIPANASDYTGECGNNTDTVSVAFLNGWKMELTFSQNTSTKKTAMTAAALTYVVTATRFPDADPSIVDKTINASNDQLEVFTVTLGKSYLCKAEQKVNLTGGVYAHTYSLQYQAFRTDNTSASFSSAIDCAADQKTSDIVPIAVGAALAALVVIVLVAYLIGRKRSARQGYQTV